MESLLTVAELPHAGASNASEQSDARRSADASRTNAETSSAQATVFIADGGSQSGFVKGESQNMGKMLETEQDEEEEETGK